MLSTALIGAIALWRNGITLAELQMRSQ